MTDLTCSICKHDFDTKTRVARLFPNCGHTFCSICIAELIDNTDDTMVCPEDKIECQFFNKAVGLGCFPLNYAIHRLVKQKGQKEGLANKGKGEGLSNKGKRFSMKFQRERVKVEKVVREEVAEPEVTKELVEPIEPVKPVKLIEKETPKAKSKPKPEIKEIEVKKPEKQKDQSDFCKEHNRKCNLVCITDNRLICTDCVLFGIHKNHEYNRIEDFKKEIKSKLTSLDSKNEVLKNKGLLLNTDKRIYDLREKVDAKRKELEESINKKIDIVIEELRSKKSDLRESLFSKFNKFDYSINIIHTTAKNIKERQKKMNTVLGRVKEQVEIEDSDYPFILKTLYSTNNIFETIRDFSNEITHLEDSTVDLIDRELEKYVVSGDVGKVIKEIHGFIEIRNVLDSNPINPAKHREEEKNIDTLLFTPNKDSIQHDNQYLRPNNNGLVQNDPSSSYDDENSNIDYSQYDNDNKSRNQSQFGKSDSVSLLEVEIDDEINSILIDRNSDENDDNSLIGQQNTSVLSHNRGGPKQSVYNTAQPYRQNNALNNSAFGMNTSFHQRGYQRGSKKLSLTPPPNIRKHTYNATFHAPMVSELKKPIKQHHSTNAFSNHINSLIQAEGGGQFGSRQRISVTNKLHPLSSRQLPEINAEELDCSRRGISDHNINDLIVSILRNKNLKALNLSHNAITEIGFEQILKKLSKHPSLERIYLMQNYLDDSIFVKLDKWAKKLGKINYFNFQHCSQFKNMVKIKKYVKSLNKRGLKIDV